MTAADLTPVAPRVLHYPPTHPYVDRLTRYVGHAVAVDDAMPVSPRLYDPEWVARSAPHVDIAHFHFGHEQHPVERVRDVVRAWRQRGADVVWTIHDLEVPHLRPAQDRTSALLEAVAQDVSTFTALTSGAAEAAAQLVGREVTTIPHGPLLTADRRMALRAIRAEGAHPPRGVLICVNDARPSLALHDVLNAASTVERGHRVRLLVNRRALQRHATAINRARRMAEVDVLVHDGLPHETLERLIARSAGLLLPYLWGTHSGLAELAADVGVPVLTTSAGFVSQQLGTKPLVAVHEGTPNGEGWRLDAKALRRVLLGDGWPAPCRTVDRERAHYAFVSGHRLVYDTTCPPPSPDLTRPHRVISLADPVTARRDRAAA